MTEDESLSSEMLRCPLLLMIFVCFSTACWGANSATVALSDLKQMGKLWYLTGETQPYTGVAVKLYDDGEKEAEIQFRDGLRHGKEIGWYPNGKLKHIVRYRRGEPQSLGSSWYPRNDPKPEPLSFALCSEHPELVAVCGEQDTSEPSRFEFCSQTSC